MNARRGLLAVLLSAALPCFASNARAGTACRAGGDRWGWYTPDYAKLQTGGYLGLLTVGTGYMAYEILDLGLFYGWVPEAVGGTDIHGVALRVGARVRGLCITRRVNWVFLEGGVGALFTFGDGFFQEVPARYPEDDYYRPTGRRLFLTIGSELALREEVGFAASHALYVEVTAIEEYLRALWKSPETISPEETLSTSLGYRMRFR